MNDQRVKTDTTPKQRLVWLDWMKVLGMFFIIAGHCYVPGYKYIYVFSVPCFFILSGFLSKKEDNTSVFFGKIWWNLFVPMLLFVFLSLVIHSIFQYLSGTFEWMYVYDSIWRALLGFVSIGLWRMWFVYTLIICKIILQFVSMKNEKVWLLVINIFMIVAARYVNAFYSSSIDPNALLNVLLAMPFFTLGYYLRSVKQYVYALGAELKIVLFFVSLVLIVVCGYYNDPVMLFTCSYGSSMPLCLLGGIAGTFAVYVIATSFQRFLPAFAGVVGGGTLIILGLHFEIITCIERFVEISGYGLYVESLLVLLIHYPIILLAKKYCPLLYGKWRA